MVTWRLVSSFKNGIRQAGDRGYNVGIVTNGYVAGRERLEPFPGLGLKDLSISDEVFHDENREEDAARRAFREATGMGLPAEILALRTLPTLRALLTLKPESACPSAAPRG